MCENCQPLFSAFAPYPMNEIVKGSIDLIRQLNYGLVYASLEEHKELSRTNLSRLTGLSPASITKITRELLDGGLVVTCGESSVGRGRRQTLLRINERRFQFLSMRLGRGYVDMALFDFSGRSLARQRHLFTEEERADLLGSLVHAIKVFLPRKSLSLACIALCLPGQVERHSGMVKHFPFYDLRNWPLGPTLQEAFSVPVLVSGDVRTWIQAEREWGLPKIAPMQCWCLSTTTSGSAWWSMVSSSRARMRCLGISVTCSSNPMASAATAAALAVPAPW